MVPAAAAPARPDRIQDTIRDGVIQVEPPQGPAARRSLRANLCKMTSRTKLAAAALLLLIAPRTGAADVRLRARTVALAAADAGDPASAVAGRFVVAVRGRVSASLV